MNIMAILLERQTKQVSPTKFRDGFSLINAYTVIKELKMKSPSITVKRTMDEQKWQIWYWKKGSENGDRKKWEEFLQKKSSFTTRKEFWRYFLIN